MLLTLWLGVPPAGALAQAEAVAAPGVDPGAPPVADLVAAPPAPWAGRLLPIPEGDLSGAEPLMRTAITEARQEIARLLAHPDTDPATLARAYGRLGALLVLREVEAPADAAFRNAMALEPQELRWPYYAGYIAMMSGNGDQALEYFRTAQALDPGYPTLYLRLGKVQLDRNALVEARANLERVAAEPGISAAARFYLGQIALLERRHQEAVDHLQAALAADPQATECHWPLAQAYRVLGRDDLARAHMAQVQPRTPQPLDPLLAQLQGAARQSVPAFQRGILAVEQRDYPKAALEFAAGLAVDPDNAAARVSYARILYLNGDWQGAERELGQALALAPESGSGRFFQALLTQDAGDTEAAAALYRAILDQEPGHAGARYYLANLDFSAGRYGEAEAGYRRVLEDEGAPPPAGLLAVLAGARAGAAESTSAAGLDALLARSPTDPQARYARIRLLAAARDGAVRDPARALELASRLAFEQPGPPALRALALAQAASGNLTQAIETQTQAIHLGGGWLPPDVQRTMEQELAAYRNEPWQPPDWAADDPLLAPPPLDTAGTFRDYPAAQPY